MPIFFPSSEKPMIDPSSNKNPRTSPGVAYSGLDLHKHARGHHEPVERLDGARIGLEDVDDPLMRPDLELLAAFLVDERGAENGVALDAGGERDRTGHLGVGA